MSRCAKADFGGILVKPGTGNLSRQNNEVGPALYADKQLFSDLQFIMGV